MTPEDIKPRLAEAKAWDIKIANLALAYVQDLAQHGAPPVFVFFGYASSQDLFYRDLCRALAPLQVPLPRRSDIMRPRHDKLRGSRARLIAVHQSYPWKQSPQAAREADEAGRLIDELNRSNGWT